MAPIGELDFDYYGAIIGVLSFLVTLLMGYQIYTVINVKKELDDVRRLKEEIDTKLQKNWQDFEKLCKLLWGEIWYCEDTIKQHGRHGQNQHGVDVYAYVEKYGGYCGIQCKGKDDYTNAELTETEIDAEIKKALTFEPKLKLLIKEYQTFFKDIYTTNKSLSKQKHGIITYEYDFSTRYPSCDVHIDGNVGKLALVK